MFGKFGGLGGPGGPGGLSGGGVCPGSGTGGRSCELCVVCLGGGSTVLSPAEVVCTGGNVFGLVVPGGCAISGPSDGKGRMASGQAEVSVAGGKTSDSGRKLSCPGSQQGPKSCWQPFSTTHSLLLVPLIED